MLISRSGLDPAKGLVWILRKTWFGFLLLGSLTTAAMAQSTISGVVRDASGAVVANAVVEASSDVLIERTRSVSTNAEGRYTIVDLRPGTYVVTVSQPASPL